MDLEASHEIVLRFRAETFDPYVSDTFRARPEKSQQDVGNNEFIEFTLIEVTRFPHIAEIEGDTDLRHREPFALLFVGQEDQTLLGSIHEVEHEELGGFCISLNPVTVASPKVLKENPNRRFYEAVFG